MIPVSTDPFLSVYFKTTSDFSVFFKSFPNFLLSNSNSSPFTIRTSSDCRNAKKWKEEDEKRKGIDDFTEEELSILPSWKQDRAMKVTRDALVKSQCSLIEAANIMFERDMKRNLEEAQSKLESGEITEEDFEKIREFLKRQEELRTKEIRELEDKNKEKIRQFDKDWEDMKIRLQEIKKSSHQS